MQLPDLIALKRGDGAEWEVAFRWLWPVVFGAARITLQPYLPDEIEDVAIEALEELVEKVRELKSPEELRPLAASIAHHRAVSHLRHRFAAKRGAGQTESLDAMGREMDHKLDSPMGDCPCAVLEQKELAVVLRELLAELKPPQGEILADFFLWNLSYQEIAKKRGVAVGSVGVYLKRGLETLRRTWKRQRK